MKTSFFAAVMISLSAFAAQASSSEWAGTWQQEVNPMGATLTFRHCNDKTCDYLFRAQSPSTEGGGCTQYGRAEFNGSEIALTPADGFGGETFKPNYYGCKVQAHLTGDSLQVDTFSKPCQNYCTGEKPYKGSLKRTSEKPLADNEKCLTEKTAAWIIWCQDEEFQKKDKEFSAIILEAEKVSHEDFKDDEKDFPVNAINACGIVKEVNSCLLDKYAARKKSLTEQKDRIIADAKKLSVDLNTPGDEAAGDKMISQIEGVYKERFDNALVSGEEYKSENILEIVRVSKSSIYFKTHLDFYNGHECNLFGKAQFSKVGRFVYQEDQCVFTIAVDGKEVVLDDKGTCKDYCGARGSLGDVHFPLDKKREIKYLARLKKSKDYINSTK